MTLTTPSKVKLMTPSYVPLKAIQLLSETFFSKLNSVWNIRLARLKWNTLYTGCIKKVGTLEYFEKYKFYQKMFQTKVVGFKKFYLLAISFWPWRVTGRSREGHFNFFKWNTLYIFAYSCSLPRELSKTLW